MTIWWAAFAGKSSTGSSFDELVANIFKPFFLYSGIGILLEIASLARQVNGSVLRANFVFPDGMKTYRASRLT
jgi:hypothetical protein